MVNLQDSVLRCKTYKQEDRKLPEKYITMMPLEWFEVEMGK